MRRARILVACGLALLLLAGGAFWLFGPELLTWHPIQLAAFAEGCELPTLKADYDPASRTITFSPGLHHTAAMSSSRFILARKVLNPYIDGLTDVRLYACNVLPPELQSPPIWQAIICRPEVRVLDGHLAGWNYVPLSRRGDPPLVGLTIENQQLTGFLAVDGVAKDSAGILLARLTERRIEPVALTTPPLQDAVICPLSAVGAYEQEYFSQSGSHLICTVLRVPASYRYYLLSTTHSRHSYRDSVVNSGTEPYWVATEKDLAPGIKDACWIYENPGYSPASAQ